MTDAAEQIAKVTDAIDRLGEKIDRLASAIEKTAGRDRDELLTSDQFQKAVQKAIDDMLRELSKHSTLYFDKMLSQNFPDRNHEDFHNSGSV